MSSDGFVKEFRDKHHQLQWDLRYLKLSKEVSKWSKDPSTQVGAAIVRPNNSVCSVGYNGFPPEEEDTPEKLNNREVKYSLIIHAEINAERFSTDESIEGYSLYTWPFMPCHKCAAHFAEKKIKRCVAPLNNNERWVDSFESTRIIFKEAGVELVEISLDSLEDF